MTKCATFPEIYNVVLGQGSKNSSVYSGRLAKYQFVGGLHYFLEVTKYINYFKQRYLGFKLRLMVETHVRRVYSTYSSQEKDKLVPMVSDLACASVGYASGINPAV